MKILLIKEFAIALIPIFFGAKRKEKQIKRKGEMERMRKTIKKEERKDAERAREVKKKNLKIRVDVELAFATLKQEGSGGSSLPEGNREIGQRFFSSIHKKNNYRLSKILLLKNCRILLQTLIVFPISLQIFSKLSYRAFK